MNEKKLNEDLTYNERLLRIQNLEAENLQLHVKNIKLRKELNEIGRKWLNDFSRQDTLITELKARWEELEEVIEEEEKLTSKLHDDFNTGSRAAYGVVLDMMGELSHKLLEQKQKVKK